jgi:hypothetical protein
MEINLIIEGSEVSAVVVPATVTVAPVPAPSIYAGIRETLRDLNTSIHEEMSSIDDAGRPEWQRLYVLARAIDALVDTAKIFNTIVDPPF